MIKVYDRDSVGEGQSRILQQIIVPHDRVENDIVPPTQDDIAGPKYQQSAGHTGGSRQETDNLTLRQEAPAEKLLSQRKKKKP